MSILTGIALSSGGGGLPGANRLSEKAARTVSGAGKTQTTMASVDAKAPAAPLKKAVTSRPVVAAEPAEKPSDDPRFVLFMKAVQALRLDYDAPDLSSQRIAELRAAARDVFMMDDGIPKEIRPPEANPDTAGAARRERVEAAERKERIREAERQEAEANRLETIARLEGTALAVRETGPSLSAPVSGDLPELNTPDLPEQAIPEPELNIPQGGDFAANEGVEIKAPARVGVAESTQAPAEPTRQAAPETTN